MTMRLSVDLADDDADRLKELSDEYELTITETVRRAIYTEWYLKSLRANKRRVLVEDTETGEFKELVFEPAEPDRTATIGAVARRRTSRAAVRAAAAG